MTNNNASNNGIFAALENVGNKIQEVANTPATSYNVGGIEVTPISVVVDKLPKFNWEAKQGFRNEESFQCNGVQESDGALIALVPGWLNTDGSISLPPSIKAAKEGNKGDNKLSFGQGGFLDPDFCITFGFYNADGKDVVLPTSVLQAYKMKGQVRNKVLVSFANDNKDNPLWETELMSLAQKATEGFPSGAFTFLVIGSLVKTLVNEKNRTYKTKYQLGTVRVSAKTLAVSNRESRAPINSANSIEFLKAQLGMTGNPTPVQSVTMPTAVQSVPAPTISPKKLPKKLNSPAGLEGITEYSDEPYATPYSEDDLLELSRSSVDCI